ncbi:secreted frizzled-related protein 5 [Daphnia magna]|uniref:Secreted frizzled-related protein 2 n=1 Tax=Daphnia magna TaxID=35525 RepID=A0A0P5AXX5_9CRUS|nr:secreted frizzled-related protein 5 [Daphnia magna]KZS17215.1 Secreted frizzled-related protein 2 [Daphnia magna]
MASWLPVCILFYVFVNGCYGNGSSLSSIGGVIGGGGAGGDTFFPDWGVGGGRAAQPTCLDIPRNLSLCHGIRYSKMRLPNLLDHDSMAEVIQQAASWVPLLNVRCHADTQLFLCSLFSPVCLDRPIYPCRGLCERVRHGCEGRMKTYGYPWPDMLRCDKFPLDNDMCIGPLSTGSSSQASDCQACEEVDTYENIMDNYCRADFVARTKLRRVRRNKVSGKKSKMLKMSSEMREEWRRNQRPNLIMELGDDCCTDHFNTVALSRTAAGGSNGGDRFLVMGVQRNGQLVPTLILPWTKRSKAIRGAVKAFKQFNCSDPKAVFASETASSVIQGNDRQRRGKQMREKTSTTTTTTSTPTTASTTRKGRGQHGGGQRSRSRADNQHQGQSVRHQHQLQ